MLRITIVLVILLILQGYTSNATIRSYKVHCNDATFDMQYDIKADKFEKRF